MSQLCLQPAPDSPRLSHLSTIQTLPDSHTSQHSILQTRERIFWQRIPGISRNSKFMRSRPRDEFLGQICTSLVHFHQFSIWNEERFFEKPSFWKHDMSASNAELDHVQDKDLLLILHGYYENIGPPPSSNLWGISSFLHWAHFTPGHFTVSNYHFSFINISTGAPRADWELSLGFCSLIVN